MKSDIHSLSEITEKTLKTAYNLLATHKKCVFRDKEQTNCHSSGPNNLAKNPQIKWPYLKAEYCTNWNTGGLSLPNS